MLGRQTPALAALLAVHLGAVMALFSTLPYGKFAHGVFRTAALLRHSVEKRQPAKLKIGDDGGCREALKPACRTPNARNFQ